MLKKIFIKIFEEYIFEYAKQQSLPITQGSLKLRCFFC